MILTPGLYLLSRYRLISLKGRGAFGEVWLARDEQADMEVAVKVYIALDDRGLEEFKSEYKNSYSLNHRNLLHAYHFDVVDQQPFLVMPYCSDSAESLVRNSDEKTLLRFIRDVASGLEYLHSKDIIHRDIKPDNVLIGQDGSFLITDFGVSAKMENTFWRYSVSDVPRPAVVGTKGYMAPELFSRTPDAVKATDIWALGATVYELATGELPFFGQGGAMMMHGADVPELKGTWSKDFQELVESCLAKETWDRPTAANLVQRADEIIRGDQISSTLPPAKNPNNKKSRKFYLWNYVLLLFAFFIAGGLYYLNKVQTHGYLDNDTKARHEVEDTVTSNSEDARSFLVTDKDGLVETKPSKSNGDVDQENKAAKDSHQKQSPNSTTTNNGAVSKEKPPSIEEKVKSSPEQYESKVAEMTISKETAFLHVGEQIQLIVYNGTSDVVWESDNPKVATVSQTGMVKAVSPGRTDIWAKGKSNYCLCTITVSGVVNNQKRVISGKVYNTSGTPMKGVSVMLKGTNYGALTNASGYYSLMASKGDVIVVSMQGHRTIEQTIDNKTHLDFTLLAKLIY